MLHLHTSTDYPLLAQAYQQVDSGIPKPLLAPHPVIVPNMAIGRWLVQQCAIASGIAANLERVLPAEFIWRLKRQLHPELSSRSDFDEGVLTFSIIDAFNDTAFCTDYPRLNSYLNGSDQLNRYHLAKRVAQAFQNYQLYRPDWLQTWEASELLGLGEDEAWQQALWARLTDGSEQTPRSELEAGLIASLEQNPDQFSLPASLCVFGVHQVPPAFFALIKAIAQSIDVHIFTWLPEGGDETPALPHWLQAAEQFESLLDGIDVARTHYSVSLEQNSHLASVQSLVLGKATALHQADGSMALASCFSPMREVEALHDYLLGRFQADASLQPGDVLVAVSDVDAYTPFIRAVFDEAENPIPYSVNESLAGKESALLKGLLGVLDITQWRFTREEVEVLLHNRLIRRRFAISEADLEQIPQWLDDAAVRWGIDGDHREELGLPNNHEHTWRAGLDRLLLGFALPCSQGGRLPLFGEQQALPVDDVESGSSELLSRFITYMELLFAWRQRFKQSYCVSEWQEQLRSLLVDFFDVDALEEGVKQQLLQVISRLGDNAQQAGSQSLLDVQTIRCILEDNYAHIGRSGRLSGAVSFTGMGTLAGLPYRAVCLLGMDYDKWPKRGTAPGFDLLAKDTRRIGDRCDSELQRFQTLQLLQSAKQSVYISYTGQDIKSAEERPESVLVAELLNAAEQAGIAIPCERHGMHPYSLTNFQRGLLQSHSSQWLQTATRIGRGEKAFTELSPQAITWEMPTAITLEELIGFFANPQKAFLRNTLGIYLRDQAEEWNNTEPFALENFTDSRVRESILANCLAQGDDETVDEKAENEGFALNRARGLLPHGEYGELLHEHEFDSVKAVLDYAPEDFARDTFELPFRQITLEVEADRGVVGLPTLDPSVQKIEMAGITKHASRQGVQHLLVGDLYDYKKVALWLEHLFLCCSRPQGVKPVTHVIYRDNKKTVKSWYLKPPQNPENLLATWIEAYLNGLSQPLAFFAKTSNAYAKSYAKHQDQDKAIGAAKALWRDGFNSSGEGSKTHNAYLYRDEEPLDEAFGAWAELLLIPLLEHASTEPPRIAEVSTDTEQAAMEGGSVSE
jgi:exodeoxyribonuclease V gamma subunit